MFTVESNGWTPDLDNEFSHNFSAESMIFFSDVKHAYNGLLKNDQMFCDVVCEALCVNDERCFYKWQQL